MKRSRNSEESILCALKQAESGTPVGDVCRQIGISETTFYVPKKKKYGGLSLTELRELRRLLEENRRLKRLVADLTRGRHLLQKVVRIDLSAELRRDLAQRSQYVFDLTVRRSCRLLQLRNATRHDRSQAWDSGAILQRMRSWRS